MENINPATLNLEEPTSESREPSPHVLGYAAKDAGKRTSGQVCVHVFTKGANITRIMHVGTITNRVEPYFTITHINGFTVEHKGMRGNHIAKAVGIYCAGQLKEANVGNKKAISFVKAVLA